MCINFSIISFTHRNEVKSMQIARCNFIFLNAIIYFAIFFVLIDSFYYHMYKYSNKVIKKYMYVYIHIYVYIRKL